MLEASLQAKREFWEKEGEKILSAAERIAAAFRAGQKLLVFGNGGSAADAQHLAAEFVNRFRLERKPLPAIALTTDTSILTAIANDYDFAEVFSKQVEALGSPGDVALGISTSGRSPNVIRALAKAREKGLFTIGLGGGDGGRLPEVSDLLILVPSSETPRIQEGHLFFIHLVCELVEEALFETSETA
ncbi:MAG: D-sedoheptulose 7-phosphate isomerase [Thermodesulfobacteria bacterium]|nr:D-sedoheptulose 7-phosphate isomerase [Thermodesulfobacteriota bacterium]